MNRERGRPQMGEESGGGGPRLSRRHEGERREKEVSEGEARAGRQDGRGQKERFMVRLPAKRKQQSNEPVPGNAPCS